MSRKEIEKLYGKDILRLHSVAAIENLIRRRRDNNLSVDKIIIKEKLIELKKYSQINHCRMTLERYTIVYDYYAKREYKKYIKKKCSEWCSTKYNHDTNSLNHFKRKYGDNELAVQKYKEYHKNKNNNVRIEYYLQKGMTYEEACKARAERQHTFSLEKCQKKYGKQKGKEIWEARQQKWLNTLNSKSDEEINDINRKKTDWLRDKVKLNKSLEKRKANLEKLKKENPELYKDKLKKAQKKRKANLEKLKKENPELYFQKFFRIMPIMPEAEKIEGHLYYLHIYNDKVSYYKIGITKFSNIKYRWNINKFKENRFNFDVVFFKTCCNYKDAYIHEQNILHKFSKFRIYVDYDFFRSSEVFNRDIFEGKYDEINI